MAGQAATWNIDFGSVEATFTAPAEGGLVSDLVVTLGGVTYDRAVPGFTAPSYDPVYNDFSAPGGGVSFSYWGSTLVGSGCPEALCLIEFEDRASPMIPPLWATNTVPFSSTLGNGHYDITPAAVGPAPIPVPAPLGLLVAGVAAIGLVRRRGRGASR